MQAALGELEFTHNNLKETNLRWHRGRFVPIRYYDARIGTAELGTGDREAFAALRHRIAEAPAPRQTANDVTAPYNPLRSLTGHRWTSHVFEGLVCVEDDNGFGFVDTDNNPVIPAQFVWAGDFREGRAEVQTQTGMGLIDRPGLLRHTSRIRNRRLRPRRQRGACAQQRALGAVRLPGTPPHGVPDGSPGALRA